MGAGEARISMGRKNRIDSAGRLDVGGDGNRRDEVWEGLEEENVGRDGWNWENFRVSV